MGEYKGTYLAKLVDFEKELARKIPAEHHVEGINGLALFYYLLYKTTGESRYLQECASRARHSLISLSAKNWERSASGGPPAEAWSLAFLHYKKIVDPNTYDVPAELDESIYINSLKNIIRENFGGNGGGAVVYALRRLPNDKASGYLKQVIGVLEASAPVRRCRTHMDSGNDFEDFTSVDLHKIICISNMLLRMYQHGLFHDRIIPLLEVCSHCLYYTLQPVAIGSSERLLWEDAPIGQLLSIFILSRVLDSDQLREEAEEVGANITWPNENGISDLSLKSGVAGLAHSLGLLHKFTGNPEYSRVRENYIEMLLRSDPVFQTSARDELARFLSGPLGIHAVLLESFAGDDEWCEFIHPVA